MRLMVSCKGKVHIESTKEMEYQLSAIGFEVGSNNHDEWIYNGAIRMDEILEINGVEHVYLF